MIPKKKTDSALAILIKSETGIVKILKAGDFVDATLIKKAKKAAYFDLGQYGTGIVFGVEYANAADIIKGLNAGDKISVKVVDAENEDGYVELSLTEAGRQKVWQEIKVLK